jgi:hypothetical protein
MVGLNFRVPAGARNVSLLQNVQTGSEAHPTSHPIGTGVLFPAVERRPERYVDHSHPPSAKVKNEWSYTSTSTLYVFMA